MITKGTTPPRFRDGAMDESASSIPELTRPLERRFVSALLAADAPRARQALTTVRLADIESPAIRRIVEALCAALDDPSMGDWSEGGTGAQVALDRLLSAGAGNEPGWKRIAAELADAASPRESVALLPWLADQVRAAAARRRLAAHTQRAFHAVADGPGDQVKAELRELWEVAKAELPFLDGGAA